MKTRLLLTTLFLATSQAWSLPFHCSTIKGSENQHGDFDIRQICVNDQYALIYRGTFEQSTTIYKVQNPSITTENQFEVSLLALNNDHQGDEQNLKLVLSNEDQLSYSELMANPNKVFLVGFDVNALDAEHFKPFDIGISH